MVSESGWDWWDVFDYWRDRRDRGPLGDGAGGVELANGSVKVCGDPPNFPVK